MAYSKNRKKNGIGREYRGRKPKEWNRDVQKYVDDTVKEVTDHIYEERYPSEGGGMAKNSKDGIMMMPDKRFDHPGLYEGRNKYTPADKIAALTAYLVTGSVVKAEVHCGVPAGTIQSWKRSSEWWPALANEIKKEKNDEMEAMLTGILHQSLDNIVDKLENGDSFRDTKTGEVYKLPVKAKELAALTGILFDKRALLRGDPTRRVENVSTEARLSKLKDEFEKFSNATEVEGVVVEDD